MISKMPVGASTMSAAQIHGRKRCAVCCIDWDRLEKPRMRAAIIAVDVTIMVIATICTIWIAGIDHVALRMLRLSDVSAIHCVMSTMAGLPWQTVHQDRVAATLT